ncbi:hypothetical protein [Endozoicomonas numazuensis]|uniref:Uncharacterized protein n=1 Tax=Endozoicomonas numazuensis TaxID=1137799 RepID=A0A081N6N0_9GAMM|nr:hypothetical protein [Endozoicomonas numazuensis]KEQ14103.1 hypothetical protein GZ78_26140 [Endozoicomonas numazuensis]
MGGPVDFFRGLIGASPSQSSDRVRSKPAKTGFFAGRTAKEVDAYKYMVGSKERFEALAHNSRVKAKNASSQEFKQSYKTKATEYDGKAKSAKSEKQLKREVRVEDVRSRQEQEVSERQEPDSNPIGEFIGNLANGLRKTGETVVREVKVVSGKATLGLMKADRENTKWSEHPLDRFLLECKILQQRAKNRWSELD